MQGVCGPIKITVEIYENNWLKIIPKYKCRKAIFTVYDKVKTKHILRKKKN